MEKIDYVDENDNVVGVGTKEEAHEKGILHRGVAVLVFNNQNQILIPTVASHKKHSGQYTSSTGGHVSSGESYEIAAKRELKEELGIETLLSEISKYRHNDLFVTLFKASFDGPVKLSDEFEKFNFFSAEEIKEELKSKPEKFSKYLLRALEEIKIV